jgi:colanic acid biosynthesis glycosyl transferase WcaI
MRILVIMLYWYPYEGPLMPIYGAIFRELIAKGHKVTIVCSFPHYRKGRNEIWKEYRKKLYQVADWEGARLIRSWVFAPVFDPNKSGLVYRALNFISFNISSLLASIFLAGKADVVFAPSSPPLTNGIISWIVSKVKRCPMVYNVQDIYPDMAIKMGMIKNRPALAMLSWIEKLVYRLSKKVLTISDSMAETIRKKGVPAEHIKVIENFIDTETITPGPKTNDFSRKHHINQDFVILYAGNIGIPHGVEVLISAAEFLRTQKGLLFCFVARGEHKEKISSMAEEKGLENVRFIDPQPEKTVPLIWASATVGAITYRKGLADFSLPSKMLACMCAARPIIASVDLNSAVANLIDKANCGICVPPESPDLLADALIKLYDNPSETETMGKNGRVYVEKYLNRHVIGDRYNSFFLDTLLR